MATTMRVSRSILFFVAIVMMLLSLTAAFDVAVKIGTQHACTIVSSLTSVTIDVCVAKQRFPFDDDDLLRLSLHLGGGDAILRIGGSDQNTFYYDTNSTKTEPYSAKSGGACCEQPGSCKGCAKDCTMPAPYWKSMVEFVQSSGHRFMFGLAPYLDHATALILHSAKKELPVFAYTFGNEIDSPEVTAGYPALRKLLCSSFPAGTAPRLAGPDVALQRHAPIDQALQGNDSTIIKKLTWVENFAAGAGAALDVLSWHTYDYETPMLGMVDHQDLNVNPKMARFWSTNILDFATRLLRNVTEIKDRFAPQAEVWLSETNSICHQGINGVTNAYLNSLWLVNRLGIMANNNVSVMARQSLIGYNYSLLGNWPVEPIRPNPDFFTTVLFRRLFGDVVLLTRTNLSSSASVDVTGGGDRARAFAFCASESIQSKYRRAAGNVSPGSVSVALLNFDASEAATFSFDQDVLGMHRDYLLAPGSDPLDPNAAWSSRDMMLNDELLTMSPPAWDLPAALTGEGELNTGAVVLPALHVAFVVFPAADLADCK